MSLSKPCERAGCSGVITAPGPRTLAKRHFCNNRCHYEHRKANGWPHHVLSTADRRKGGRVGGAVAGERRRRQAARRKAEAVAKLVTHEMRERLTHLQVIRLTAIFAQAFSAGYKRGYRTACANAQARGGRN